MAVNETAGWFINWAQTTVSGWGYLGIFLVNLIGSASIIFPIPAFAVTFTFGAVFNPWLVGIAAGLGAAAGEFTGYVLGFGSREVIERKHKDWLDRTRKWVDYWGIFPILVVFAATPLPDDIVGIAGGVIKYDFRKFFLAVLTGKVVMSLALAWGGFYGLNWVLGMFGGL